MSREIYDIINDMAEVLNPSQMQKLQEVLVKRLSENVVSDYLQTTKPVRIVWTGFASIIRFVYS